MVQTNPYQGGAPAQPAARDPWDILEGGGGPPAIKFGTRDQFNRFQPAPLGTSYTGILAEDLTASVITDFETGQPAEWPDGRFKEQIIAVVQTDERLSEDDNGLRRIFFKGQMFTALQTEIREKKTGRIGVGTRLTVTLVDLKPSTNPQYSPQNIFRVDIGPEIAPWVPAEQRAVDSALGGYEAGTPAGVAQQTAAAAQAGFPPAQQVSPNLAAINALAGQNAQQGPPPLTGQVYPPVQQAQPAQAIALVTQEDVDGVATLMKVGLPKDTAISQVAGLAPRPEGFVQALTAATAGL